MGCVSTQAHNVLLTHRLDDVIRSVKEEIPSANLRALVMDLSSLSAVREAAAEVNAYPEVFHVRSCLSTYLLPIPGVVD